MIDHHKRKEFKVGENHSHYLKSKKFHQNKRNFLLGGNQKKGLNQLLDHWMFVKSKIFSFNIKEALQRKKTREAEHLHNQEKSINLEKKSTKNKNSDKEYLNSIKYHHPRRRDHLLGNQNSGAWNEKEREGNHKYQD